MTDYTPDWIHIYSAWWHYIPPAIGALVVLAVGFFLVFRRRILPRFPAWLAALVLVISFLATGFLLFVAWGHDAWSIHASDYIEKGISQSGLHNRIDGLTGLKLPRDCKREAGVVMGWREYKSWFCLRGGWQGLRSQALFSRHTESKGNQGDMESPIPEPIAKWLEESGFHYDLSYHRNTGNAIHVVFIDSTRDLALITVTDY